MSCLQSLFVAYFLEFISDEIDCFVNKITGMGVGYWYLRLAPFRGFSYRERGRSSHFSISAIVVSLIAKAEGPCIPWRGDLPGISDTFQIALPVNGRASCPWLAGHEEVIRKQSDC